MVMVNLLRRVPRTICTWPRTAIAFPPRVNGPSGHARFGSGKLPVAFDDEPEAQIVMRKPRRRWMSVADLVTEVDVSLVKGERLSKTSEAYTNMESEASRLRIDNDAIMAEVHELKAARAKYIAFEDKVSREFEAGGSEAELVEVIKQIQYLDSKLASLRRQHHQKIRDIGLLKRAMFKISQRGEVISLIQKAEEGLRKTRGATVQRLQLNWDSPEAEALSEMVNRLRQDLDKVAPKIAQYEVDVKNFVSSIHDSEKAVRAIRDIPSREADSLRMEVIFGLRKAQRMNKQLTRLRDIQIETSTEIGMLERVRLKLLRHDRIRKLIEAGDEEQITAKLNALKGDVNDLQAKITVIEGGLQENSDDAIKIVENLRSKRDEFSPETGKLREMLVANIRQEEQQKMHLAALRGEKVQDVRFIAMLTASLSE